MIDDRPPRPENRPAAGQHAEQAGAKEAHGETAEHAPHHSGPVEEAALGWPRRAAGAPIAGVPGWVKVRFMGCAAFGAVVVLGGAE